MLTGIRLFLHLVMLMPVVIQRVMSIFLFPVSETGNTRVGIIGTTPFHLILYSVIVVAITWFLMKSETRSLIRTKRLLREKERALFEIEYQRADLEFKNKSITDSLTYAQRIQEALLPSGTYLKKYFSESFIFYKPKDIVSGDFYWIGEKDLKKYIVAADCTGHGVPGALMSMIGHNLLEKIIISENTDHPAMILDRMNSALDETFNRDKNVGTTIRDGMDMGVCVIDAKNKRLEFAGAFFPLYIIRDNKLLEIKGDKCTLGMATDSSFYKNTEMDLEENDILYLFSDGYVDQFGGEKNKKFMYRRFRYLLITIHSFPLADQCSILEDNIKTWQGNNPQVDDFLIIGFKPL
jgi:serine phosphatase RsbU (regulator of sigma subunit)